MSPTTFEKQQMSTSTQHSHPLATAVSRTQDRIARTVSLGTKPVQVWQLTTPHRFTRKPVDLTEARREGTDRPCTAFVTETIHLTTDAYDGLANAMLVDHDWLKGKGGHNDEGEFCVEVIADKRATLLINPEGYSYARYVAVVG